MPEVNLTLPAGRFYWEHVSESFLGKVFIPTRDLKFQFGCFHSCFFAIKVINPSTVNTNNIFFI